MGILNKNKEGFDDGYKDAMAGKSNNSGRNMGILRSLRSFPAAEDTYRKGYAEGYRKGSHDRQ